MTPAMSRACGLTAYSAPVNPALTMFIRIARPMTPAGARPRPRPPNAARAGLQAGHVGALLPAGYRVEIVLASLSATLCGIGMLSSTTPSSRRRRAHSPASANTRSMAAFSGRVPR